MSFKNTFSTRISRPGTYYELPKGFGRKESSIALDRHAKFKLHHLLRSIGLGLLTQLGFGQTGEELPKPITTVSLKIALSRAAVHFLPSITSITVIAINLKNIFIGRTFTGPVLSIAVNSAMLQVASKIQELLIVASLASIVVHTIRREMIGREGVPFGVLGGAFLFSSISYFWSPDFWGSFRSNDFDRKWRFYGLLVLSGLLAGLAGPSTAVLIIPRDQSWNAGGATIFLRGGAQDLWPSIMNNDSSFIQPFCAFPNATLYAVCPSGGFDSMLDFAQTRFPIYNTGPVEMNVSSDLQFAPQTLTFPSSMRLAPTIILSGNYRNYACETAVVGVRMAESILMSQLQDDWNAEVMSIPYDPMTSTISEYKYYEWIQTETNTQIPAVRVGCSDAQNVSAFENMLNFPKMPEYGCWNSYGTLNYTAINQSASSTIRTTWINLPSTFGTASAGLVFEAPWDYISNSRVVVGCTVDARWTNGTVASKTNSDMDEKQYIGTVLNASPKSQSSGFSEFRPIPDSSWRPIRLQLDWLNTLTPLVKSLESDGNSNTLDLVLERSDVLGDSSGSAFLQAETWNEGTIGSLNRTVTIEWILSHLITNGLSRDGSSRVLSTNGPPSTWSLLYYNKSTAFQADLLGDGQPILRPDVSPIIEEITTISIGGLSYQACQVTDYLAIVVLLVHILLALAHTIEITITRRSSSCWDSLNELLAIALKSQPPKSTLGNSGAGIRELSTYGTAVRARGFRGIETGKRSIARVELVCGDEEIEESSRSGACLPEKIHADTLYA